MLDVQLVTGRKLVDVVAAVCLKLAEWHRNMFDMLSNAYCHHPLDHLSTLRQSSKTMIQKEASSALRAAKWVMGWSRATWFCGISFWAPRWLPARLNRKYGAGCLCNQLYSSKKNCWQLWFLSQNTCWATHAALYIIHQGCSLLGHSKPWLKSFKRGVPSVDSPFFPQHWTHPAPSGPAQRVASNNEFKGRCLAKTWHQEWGSPNHHFLGQLQAKCMEDNLSLYICVYISYIIISIHVYVHIYIYTYVCTRIHIDIYIYMCVGVCFCLRNGDMVYAVW